MKSNEVTKSKQGGFQISHKHIKFMEALAKGVKLADAHKLAGFKGTYAGARALREKLKEELVKVQEDQGYSKTFLVGKLLNLLSLPCVDAKGQALSSITVTQLHDTIRLIHSMMPEKVKADAKIIPFLIVRNDSPADKARPVVEVQEAQLIKPEALAEPKPKPKPSFELVKSELTGRMVKRKVDVQDKK